jgi:hypothetical protein
MNALAHCPRAHCPSHFRLTLSHNKERPLAQIKMDNVPTLLVTNSLHRTLCPDELATAKASNRDAKGQHFVLQFLGTTGGTLAVFAHPPPLYADGIYFHPYNAELCIMFRCSRNARPETPGNSKPLVSLRSQYFQWVDSDSGACGNIAGYQSQSG